MTTSVTAVGTGQAHRTAGLEGAGGALSEHPRPCISASCSPTIRHAANG